MVNHTNFATLCLPVQSDSETTTASSGTFKFAACTPSQTHFNPHCYLSRQVLADASASDAGLHLSLCVFPDCREEKFPCTRLYSVHKPVKQCISYLCVTSVRRMYIINKEVCSRIVCKENEVMQDEICRQLAGLPSRRLRRSGQPLHLPCRQLLEQQQRRRPDAL
uniref:Microfibril associated protein 5 n=1 Tax=Buteo japonicus TaxID=224669 RepID=A0A8B9Z337_9AVES